MIITSDIAKSNLVNFSNKDTKLSRDVKNGKLIKIVNGLYETDSNTSPYLLAGSIYGPSYISFDYALFLYGLIPEKVNVVTSATFNKKKKKIFNTSFGTYTYRDVPQKAYPKEINLKEENNYAYQIASKEKALCDKLYTLKPIKNLDNLKKLLFDDLRIDEDIFESLDIEKIEKLSNLYHSTNVSLLAKYMKRLNNE